MATMTFEDLPPRASEIPLTNRRVASDVIDLIVGDTDRAAGCVGVMICDSEDRGIQPIVLHDVPPEADAHGLAQLLDLLLPLVAENDGSVLIGRGRPHGTAPNDLDRAWHRSCQRTVGQDRAASGSSRWRSTGVPITRST